MPPVFLWRGTADAPSNGTPICMLGKSGEEDRRDGTKHQSTPKEHPGASVTTPGGIDGEGKR